MVEEDKAWELKESWMQMIMLGLGVIGLFLLGMFPQVLQPFIKDLPALFEHLGQ